MTRRVLHRSMVMTAVSAASIAVGAIGMTALHDTQAATAAQPVEATKQQMGAAQDMSALFRQIGAAVGPSVVSLRVSKTVDQPPMPSPFSDPRFREFFKDLPWGGDTDVPPEFHGNAPFHEMGQGSGVIMDASGGNGYVLTNNHVADHASDVDVTLADGREIKNAKVIGADPRTDLAVVEIKADNLTPAKWGDSNLLQQGDWVTAFGSPFGYVGSMTHGIVSGLHRQAGILGATGYENFIQVDAPINPGNSGGPLVNVKGEVVGINTAIASASGGFQGVGFAVPSDQAKPIYETLKDKGKIVRGWLGIEIASVSQMRDQAKGAGYKGDEGVLVKGVMAGAPATGQLQPGDVITSLNGKPMKDSMELRDQVAVMAPGAEATFGVFRDGKQQDIKVKLGEQPENPNVVASRSEAGHGERTLGMRLADLTDSLAQQYALTGKTGALVLSVQPGSAAAEAGLHVGDLITRIDKQDVHNAAGARELLSKADLKTGIRLFVNNRSGAEFIFVQRS